MSIKYVLLHLIVINRRDLDRWICSLILILEDKPEEQQIMDK